MITIGYNQVQEKHVADTNSTRREDAHEAKKVYVGNKLAHVHVNDNTEFALRQTLNGYIHEDNDLYAKISKIKGNTKVWNQLIQNPTFVDSSGWEAKNGTGTVSNNEYSFVVGSSSVSAARIQTTINVSANHVYLFAYNIYSDKATITQWGVSYNAGFGSIQEVPAGVWTKYAQIKTIDRSGSILFYLYCNARNNLIEGDTAKYRNVNLYDLTLIYGAGNEPTTVAEFEADFQQWFGRPIGAEPYDAGSLIPFMGTGIKSTGFNLWDEEWEVGDYKDGTKDDNVATKLRSKNKIPIIPGATYFYKSPVNCNIYLFGADEQTIVGLWLRSPVDYDEDHPQGSVNNLTWPANASRTIPKNCRYITISTYGSSYTDPEQMNGKFCINLSNPTLNGTYVPYKATTVPIPVTTLTGKQSGSTTSELIFPDGMKSAGSVKDEVYVEDGKTYAVKRVGSVDLGSQEMNWTYYSDIAFVVSVPNASNNNIIQCAKYELSGVSNMPLMSDKSIRISIDGTKSIIIKDSSYTDATTFKTAMSGVMLYYELATPIVYEVDNYTLPLYYPANGTGTEELQSTATSAPADMDIEYRLRQRVRLVDMGTSGVLWADSDIDITKPDGFCDNPYTYDKSFFSWGNVVGHNPISNNAFDYDWGDVNQAEPWYEGQAYGSTPGNTLTGNIPADAQYDAAKAVLGGNWRMPSSAEYGALFSICKFLEADGSDMDTSKTDKRVDMPDGNGGTVKGIYIESTVTGNRLFFSCSGFGHGRSWYYRGPHGYYWSSTCYSARNARSLGYASGGVNPQSNGSRYYGFALRPVYPISQ